MRKRLKKFFSQSSSKTDFLIRVVIPIIQNLNHSPRILELQKQTIKKCREKERGWRMTVEEGQIKCKKYKPKLNF